MSSLAATTETASITPRRSYIAGVVYDTVGSTGAKVGLVWIGILVFCAVFAPMLANSFPLLVNVKGEGVSAPFLRYLTTADVTLLIATVAAGVLFGLCRRVPMAHRVTALVWITLAVIPMAGWAGARDLYQSWVDVIGVHATVTIFLIVAMIYLAIVTSITLLSGASMRFKLGVAGVMLGVLALLIVFPVRPPVTQIYQKYRNLEGAGQIVWVVNAPIPYSPTDRLRDQANMQDKAPSWSHLLGTEDNGADVLSRMIHASRIALSIGFISTSIAMVIGVILGGLMGYFSKGVDLIGMRLVEIFEAIPPLYLLLTFVAFFPRNLYIMMAIIGFTSWTGYARFTRAEFLRLREQDFVQAAKACGLPLRSILYRHMLPNGIAPVIVTASFGVASAILSEAMLSFLGLGLVDEPSWGQLLEQAVSPSGGFSWWIAIFPGLAIFLTVFAYNLVGESLRDAIDPQTKKASHL